jgi:hypothetical protein
MANLEAKTMKSAARIGGRTTVELFGRYVGNAIHLFLSFLVELLLGTIALPGLVIVRLYFLRDRKEVIPANS